MTRSVGVGELHAGLPLMSTPGPVIVTAVHGVVHLPSKEALFTSMYAHAGPDLLITTPEGVRYLVKGFFLADPPPALGDGHGVVIDGAHAAQFAGPITVGVYAQAGGAAAAGPQIGQIRNLTGTGNITRVNGTVVPVALGVPLFQNDRIDTDDNSTIGITLIDGTTLAMDAKAELTLDELVYDPNTHDGRATVQLVSGAASFISGQIAKSGQDHMMFKTPVATIGIRGTKVYVSLDPATGDITILNRPQTDANGNNLTGRIALFSQGGAFSGEIGGANQAWQFNPGRGEQPQQVQLTEQQAQTFAGRVETVVQVLQTQLPQNLQPQAPAPAPGQQGPGGAGNQPAGNAPQGNQGGQGGGQGGQGGNAQGDGAQGGGNNANNNQNANNANNGNQGGGDGGGGGNTPTVTVAARPQGTFTAGGTASGSTTGGSSSGTGTGTGGGTTGGGSTNFGAPSFSGSGGGNSGGNTSAPGQTANNNTLPTTTVQPVVLPAQITVTADATPGARPGSVTFTIARSGNLTASTTITYTTQDGTAHAGVDYTTTTGSVTFANGESTKTVTVPLLVGGNNAPGNENFALVLSGANLNTLLTTGQAIGTVAPTPAQITAVTAAAAVARGGSAVITLTRSGNLALSATVNFTMTDGTAKAGTDYTGTPGSVTFAAGETTKTITVPILKVSTAVTSNETFTVNLTSIDSAVHIGTTSVTATVAPTFPVLTVDSVSVSDLTASTVLVTVKRTGDLSAATTVTYHTVNGTATAGKNFEDTSGTLTFAANEATKTFSVAITNIGPLTFKNQHLALTFGVQLTDPTNGVVGTENGGVVTIEATPVVGAATFTITSSVSTLDGDTTANVVVTRGGDLTGQVAVKYASVNGTAVGGTDFTTLSGTLTFAPGETTKTIPVTILPPKTTHDSEQFTIVLSDPDGGNIQNATSTVSIGAHFVPTITILDPSISNVSGGVVTLTVKLSTPSTTVITVNYSTQDGSASANNQYTPTNGTLTFQPGETSKTISVTVAAQPTFYTSTAFSVVLSSPVGATLSTTSANVNIIANSPPGSSTTVSGPNHAPVSLGTAFMPVTNPAVSSPAGATLTSILGSVYTDADGNSMSGVAITGNNAATQGTWQWSSNAGVTWQSIGTVASGATALLLSANTLVRFVPAAGFIGVPPGIGYQVMDSTYTGTFSDSSTNTRVLLGTVTAGGTSYLASADYGLFALVLPSKTFTATSGDWATGSNWTGGTPGSGDAAVINGAVTLQNGTTNTVAGLVLNAAGSLTLSTSGTVLTVSSQAYATVGSTITLNGGELDVDGNFAIMGTFNLGTSSNSGTLGGLGPARNFGTFNAVKGTVNSDFTNSATMSVSNVGTDVKFIGTLFNGSGATLTVSGTTTSSSLLVNKTIQNAGTITLTSATAAQAISLKATGGFFNNSGGAVSVNAGAGGSRDISGDFNNNGSASLTINATTVYQGGTLTNLGTLAVAANVVLGISSGARLNFASSTATLVGGGSSSSVGAIQVSDGGSVGVNALTTLPLGMRLSLGSLGGSSATMDGNSTLLVNGTLSSAAGNFLAPLTIGSGGLFALTGDHTVTVANTGVLVQSGGQFLVLGISSFDGYVTFNSTLSNSGTVTLAVGTDSNLPAVARNVTLDFSGGSFTNSGSLYTTVGSAGGTRNLVGTLTNNSSAFFNVQTATNYSGGTLHNSGSIVITAGTSGGLTIGSGATLEINTGSTLVASGATGSTLSTILIDSGATLNWTGSATVPTGMALSIGSTSNSNGSNGGPATWSGSGTANISGTVAVQSGTVSVSNIFVNVGGTLVALNNGLVTLSGNIIVQGTSVTSRGIFFVGGGTDSDAYVKATGNVTNSGLLYIAAVSNGTGGPQYVRDVTLDMTGGSLSNSSNGVVLFDAGSFNVGGGRTMIVTNSISNFGLFSFTTDTTLRMNSASFINNAAATFSVAPAAVVDMVGSGHSLSNAGIMTLNGVLNMHGGSLTNSGSISGSGQLNMQGGTFTGTGTSTIAPGNSPGHLTIDGNAIFVTGNHTEIQLAGTSAGKFDVLDITGHFTIGGNLSVVAYDDFAPKAGDSFSVIHWGDHSGTFDSASGLADFGPVALDPILDDHGLTLVARTITQQAGDGDQTLVAGPGDNVLVGGKGHDILVAGNGSDLLIGGSGDTTFVAGSGSARMVGGSGNNTVDFSHITKAVDVNLAKGTAEAGNSHDTLIGIQNVIGTSLADKIVGNGHDNVITGGGGADTLTGGGGHTTYQYNAVAEGGDTITDFQSGRDVVSLLESAFGVGSKVTAGENFSVVQAAFTGNNAGTNAAFAAANPSLIFSVQDHALYYDANGAAPGYTLVAHLEPGAVLNATDVHVYHGTVTA